MVALILAVVAAQQTPLTLPSFASWDGKNWAGLSVGFSEDELGKKSIKSKTVGPDPASVRVATDKKGTIFTALLTGAGGKGHVCGFTVELERNEPLESLETLQTELGAPDYTAYAPIRYSDWSLAVWSSKGIAAVVLNGARPLVKQVMLGRPDVMAKDIDTWERNANLMRDVPRLNILGFDVNVKMDPRRRDDEDEIERVVRRRGRRLWESGGGQMWIPGQDHASRLKLNFALKRGDNRSVNGTLEVMASTPFGPMSFNESSFQTGDRDRDMRDLSEAAFDDLMNKLDHDLQTKINRLMWQQEWRQVTNLTRVKG